LIQRAREFAADYSAELVSCSVLDRETQHRED
jgi:hypothetical protein